MRLDVAILLFALALPVPGARAQVAAAGDPSAAALSNKDVVGMVASGLSEGIVKAKIENSPCKFDTSPQALAELKAAGVPESVILAMVTAKPVAGPAPISTSETERMAMAAKEKKDAQARCPGCLAVIVSSFNSSTRTVTDDWLTKNQLAYMKERAEKNKKDGTPHRIWFTRYKENADYIIVWSSAVGSRPYTVYVPQTSTSTTQVSGDLNLTAQTSSTSYMPEHGEREFVNVVAAVYSRDGKKLYETAHQGNWRWSKPDKDCLEDALNYLLPKPQH